MVRAIKTMFGGKSGFVGSDGKLKVDTLIFRTGVDMQRKTFSGIKTVKIRDLKIRRK
tara:strand:+ start:207 stop:377 length:171 start_codon:yes stop_codon:yes gene_type:complete